MVHDNNSLTYTELNVDYQKGRFSKWASGLLSVPGGSSLTVLFSELETIRGDMVFSASGIATAAVSSKGLGVTRVLVSSAASEPVTETGFA